MERSLRGVTAVVVVAAILLSACILPPGGRRAQGDKLNVVAVESFLADIAQNVAGHRLTVSPLLPPGVDPHSYQPTPGDLAKVAASTVLIINGGGLEEFLDDMLKNVGGQRLVIEAAAGLPSRKPQSGEAVHPHEEGDPHFWLDPNNIVMYVQNIRDGLSAADPAGAAVYKANAEAYTKKLAELDAWVRQQVEVLPPDRRLLVTNHESLGYFADRYGFTIVGSILASVSTTASPSAQDMARLVNDIRATGAKAIFVESGANPQLAKQVAREAGIVVIENLNTHAVSTGGAAPTYVDMIKQLVTAIVAALR